MLKPIERKRFNSFRQTLANKSQDTENNDDTIIPGNEKEADSDLEQNLEEGIDKIAPTPMVMERQDKDTQETLRYMRSRRFCLQNSRHFVVFLFLKSILDVVIGVLSAQMGLNILMGLNIFGIIIGVCCLGGALVLVPNGFKGIHVIAKAFYPTETCLFYTPCFAPFNKCIVSCPIGVSSI